MSPLGEFRTLYAFSGGADGGHSVEPLIQASNGHLFGSTSNNESGESASIFEMTLAGVKTILHSSGVSGHRSLVSTREGDLFGVAQYDRTFFTLPLVLTALTQPLDRVAVVGDPAGFLVGAAVNPPPTFQWQFSTDGGGSWTDVPNTAPYAGGTSAWLTIAGVDLLMNGTLYRSVVTHPSGTLTSNTARLTVLDPAQLKSPAPGTGGFVTLADAADQRWLALAVVEGRSYCAQAVPARTATNQATPTLTAYRADANLPIGTPLAPYSPTPLPRTDVTGARTGTASRADTNEVLAAGSTDPRACFVAPATETALLSLTQTDTSARTYRVSLVETTLWANWYYIGGDYSSFTLLRNTTIAPVSATITWRGDTGAIVWSERVSIPAGGVAIRDTRTVAWGVIGSAGAIAGSVEVAHTGEPQALVGSQTTLSPTTGLSSDTVMTERRSWK